MLWHRLASTVTNPPHAVQKYRKSAPRFVKGKRIAGRKAAASSKISQNDLFLLDSDGKALQDCQI
jgi:hypothetical protein